MQAILFNKTVLLKTAGVVPIGVIELNSANVMLLSPLTLRLNNNQTVTMDQQPSCGMKMQNCFHFVQMYMNLQVCNGLMALNFTSHLTLIETRSHNGY